MPLHPYQPYWQNLLCLLQELQDKGVRMKLSDDTVEFQYSVKKGVLSEEEKAGIEICRESLTRVLRLREGLCVMCGMDAAKRPNLIGRFLKIVGQDEDGVFQTEWIPGSASDRLKTKHPPMFCDTCWQNGAYVRLMGGKTSAKGREVRAQETDPTDSGVQTESHLFQEI